VLASIEGDEDAWDEMVRRHARLIAMVIRQYRLSPTDAQDVSQLVWLRLVEHLTNIREPEALPGWILITARHECQRYVRHNGRSITVDPLTLTGFRAEDQHEMDETLLAAERHGVLLEALADLPAHQRQLLLLLVADPPYPYSEISRILSIPVGSIGPTRQRALERLRETTAVQTYLLANSEPTRTGGVRDGTAELER
jgi:RNA polymerase sigma factor (sigma-70 family)